MLQERTGREREEEGEKLRQQIKELQTQIDTHQVMAEMKLKTNLEQWVFCLINSTLLSIIDVVQLV